MKNMEQVRTGKAAKFIAGVLSFLVDSYLVLLICVPIAIILIILNFPLTLALGIVVISLVVSRILR